MRLDEFYYPEEDQEDRIDRNDVRKCRLTLRDVKKMRRIKDIRQAETGEYLALISKMYAPQAE